MFRHGDHNGHTVYWDDDYAGPNRFVATAMTTAAAEQIADALNITGAGAWVADLPPIPRREATR